MDENTQVTDAALARYPGATVLRVETGSDGVNEAHLQTADGARVTVEVGPTLRSPGKRLRRPTGEHGEELRGSGGGGGGGADRAGAGPLVRRTQQDSTG